MDKTWLDFLTAIGSIATPLLVLLLTAVGWKVRQSIEHKTKLEEKLRDERIEIYHQILEPYIIMLMTDAAWKSDPKNKGKDKFIIGTTKLLSLEYRKVSFRLSLIGSDEVVKAFNNLYQYFYNTTDNSESTEQSNLTDKAKEMMSLIGLLLLEIRKSMGNETTELNQWDMLEWFITDARKMKEK
ncbi:hypothetical protein [Aggregatibacter actinomycetemcomitans]|nr:hypothetical protein [Aggregatibacter actinomycetemcomitans]KYK76300.1 hypothetical protein SA3096_01815 [Aggregatibacter actinomycetemcomitans serotype e str. SA3096]KYK77555.1 hypothetical protein SC936_10645 [Aggregatibacter actinomycetemcomitans serotype e str. SC936]MBN6071632.1 hypothetical protein [Aggregatibacter actinomycetemcomitans]TYB21251.1 hypothetical protein FXB85_03010 [Aggregatibacter actinomycetemcomitans]